MFSKGQICAGPVGALPLSEGESDKSWVSSVASSQPSQLKSFRGARLGGLHKMKW